MRHASHALAASSIGGVAFCWAMNWLSNFGVSLSFKVLVKAGRSNRDRDALADEISQGAPWAIWTSLNFWPATWGIPHTAEEF